MHTSDDHTADGLRIQIADLREQVRRAEQAHGARWYWAEKFVLPIMIAVGSGLIAIAQIAVGWQQSRTELAVQAARDSTSKQLQYLQLFYDDLGNLRDPVRQSTSLELLQSLEPNLGGRIALTISENPAYPTSVRARAAKLAGSVRASELLGYDVNLYYRRDHAASREQAQRMAADLRGRGMLRVNVEPRALDFFARNVPPRGREVRFNGDVERPAAQALLAMLERGEWTGFVLQKAPAREPDSRLSIFLPYD